MAESDEFALFRDSSNIGENNSISVTEANQSINLKLNKQDFLTTKPLVLIVDDDYNVRDALKITLEKNYNLIICSNGNDAIENVNSSVFAVILDIKMEGKNGFETFIEIKKKNIYLPIIFHSAYQDIKNPYEIINDYRPFGYVIKEGDGKELLDTIKSAVDYYFQINKNAVLIKLIEKSEKKYRDLVENSLDIIFSLDADGRILSINQSVTRILKYTVEDIINEKFIDLVYKSNSLNENMVQEKFQELFDSNETVSFNCDLITKFGEPKEMHLKLQYITQHDSSFVIFGTASSIEDDILLRLCESESQVYKIGNFLTHVDIVSQRLSSAAAKYCNLETTMNLRLCIRELLINAMEHGNLGISFDEKSLALDNGDYISMLIDRQKDLINTRKKIIVEYSLTPEKIIVSISDAGNGFDHKKMLTRSRNDKELSRLSHGRGIMMAKDFFDTMDFNTKGNSVFCEKRLKS